MFYDALGQLVGYSAEVLRHDVRPHVTDDRARVQLDAAAAVCADLGAMWPLVFRALRDETRILEDAVGAEGDRDDTDDLRRYRVLLRRVNAELDRLHAPDSAGRSVRLAELRKALVDAASIQEDVVSAATAATAGSAVRRV